MEKTLKEAVGLCSLCPSTKMQVKIERHGLAMYGVCARHCPNAQNHKDRSSSVIRMQNMLCTNMKSYRAPCCIEKACVMTVCICAVPSHACKEARLGTLLCRGTCPSTMLQPIVGLRVVQIYQAYACREVFACSGTLYREFRHKGKSSIHELISVA